MALREAKVLIRKKQTAGGNLPANAQIGEPFINIYDGLLKFSGATGGSFTPSSEAGVFEVGSFLTNQKVTGYTSINDNLIISGSTGKIHTYEGTSSLSGKFLSGGSAGFVLAEISDIAGEAAGNTGEVQFNSGNAFSADSSFVFDSSNNTLRVESLSATTVSGGTIYSGGTDLYNIFVDEVVGGTNINTTGTSGIPIVNLDDNITLNSVSATTISGGTIYSGGTDLGDIFQTMADDNQTRVQPGSNITTGGTLSLPVISLSSSISIDGLTTSGDTTLGSGGEDSLTVNAVTTFNTAVTFDNTATFDDDSTFNSAVIFNDQMTGNDDFYLSGQLRVSGDTFLGDSSDDTLTVNASSTFNNGLSATTLSGGTIYSGSTDLSDIFQTIAGDNQTFVQPGSNITTGGTASLPIVNLSSSISIDGLTTSGSTTIGDDISLDTLTVNAITTFNTGVTIGNGGTPGTPGVGDLTVHGNLTIFGDSISAHTSQLYIEDNTIELNYNPTADTTSTSLGSGWIIQDGSGVSGTDVVFDVRGTSTGLNNRSFTTNLWDIRIRESGTTSSPNGVRLIAEQDIIDGGSW